MVLKLNVRDNITQLLNDVRAPNPSDKLDSEPPMNGQNGRMGLALCVVGPSRAYSGL